MIVIALIYKNWREAFIIKAFDIYWSILSFFENEIDINKCERYITNKKERNEIPQYIIWVLDQHLNLLLK